MRRDLLKNQFIRDIAQFGRVPALGVGCRRFESYYPDGFLYLALYRFPILEFKGLFTKILRLVKK